MLDRILACQNLTKCRAKGQPEVQWGNVLHSFREVSEVFMAEVSLGVEKVNLFVREHGGIGMFERIREDRTDFI